MTTDMFLGGHSKVLFCVFQYCNDIREVSVGGTSVKFNFVYYLANSNNTTKNTLGHHEIWNKIHVWSIFIFTAVFKKWNILLSLTAQCGEATPWTTCNLITATTECQTGWKLWLNFTKCPQNRDWTGWECLLPVSVQLQQPCVDSTGEKIASRCSFLVI